MTSQDPSHVTVLVPPDLENGFLLAGVAVRTATSNTAETILADLLTGGTQGVIGVYEPFLDSIPAPTRRRLEQRLSPVVVAIPTGLEGAGAAPGRAALLARVQRAIGFHVTFGEESE